MATDKEVLLINSFEIFMKDYDNNIKNISKLIRKMTKINLEIALDLWKNVLTLHPETYKGSENWDSDQVTTNILSSIEEYKEDNYDTCVDIIKADELIRLATFKYSASLDYPLENILWRGIARSEFEVVYECLEMVSKNMSAEETVVDFINNFIQSYEDEYNLVDDSDEWKSKSIEFIISLTSLLSKEEDKAKATVALIDYI